MEEPNGGASLGQYAGNLQVLWVCWSQFGAVCWEPTGLMGCVEASLEAQFL